MSLYFFTFLLYITNYITSCNSQFIVNENLMVHYDTLYSNNYRFYNALNDNYIIGINKNNTSDCKYDCANNSNCLGIYENYDNDYYCNLLSNIEGNIKISENSNSIVRINHWNYPLENHSITGIIWDSDTFTDKQYLNTTIYLDLNHNGLLDIGEPSIIANNKDEFKFDNITSGNYLVRQLPPDNCVQFYPGINGSFMIGDNNINGDGFIDNIIRYKHHGHSYGGYVNNHTYKIKNDNFSFIVGNDNSTFMSFYPDHSMEGIFIDESIINIPGNDLIITVLESNSTTIANISVSHDDSNFKFLGVLNSSISEHLFDLDNIDYKLPVIYIKLDFIGVNDSLNIISIGTYNNSIYLPSFAYNINIPKKETIIFINNCHYDFSCNSYCDFNILNDDDYYSCSQGCEVFEKTNACNCSTILSDDFVFDHDYCLYGCEYGIQQHIFPNYTLLSNYNGNNEAIISNDERCDINCLDNLVNECDLIDECRSLSYSENNIIGNLFDNYKHSYERNSFFIIKNSYFGTTSSTTTTTISTSITSTQTTTPTSTPTSSLTSTQTTSPTSSQTSTQTSSLTSTQKSSQTSSQTSTPTSSLTSSQTSTPTSTPTSTGTNNHIIINDMTNTSGLSNTYKHIIIVIGSLCLLLILIMLIALINRCIKQRNIPKQNHISIHNPVYEPNFENEPPELSLYNDVMPNYDDNNDYLEIVKDSL